MEEFLASPIAYFGIDEYVFNSAVLGAVAGLLGSEVGTVAVFSRCGRTESSPAPLHAFYPGISWRVTSGALFQFL
jgi:hypothetical protein